MTTGNARSTVAGESSGGGVDGLNRQRGAPPFPIAAKKWRRADTNVIAVKFDRLTAPSNMHTGDMVKCTNCEAMLSHISKLSDEGEDKVRYE